MTRNQEALESFTAYCKTHPNERFWQALCNWSKFQFILGRDTTRTVDTFSIEGLAGTRVPVQPCGTCHGHRELIVNIKRNGAITDYDTVPCPDCSSQEPK